ncbi:DoxX family protein [Aureicoccus marinus]|jgi:uncharacterized membrane protein YphA (DoxX/SURF4 family)|uniref:DoxX family protein n=1 Tax=Aureicoccus marinus TaxID=754435 RepID=A0A2S7T9Q8_9FLAO|nr:DoxX family protein [Aureicoccus marinus]PQJ16247.1 hypothetical protein BST99_11405 [Aureicoccus marinus]
MNTLDWSTNELAITGLLLFFAIAFLQSGIDKCLDFKGNLAWLKGHFKDSPLASMVPLLLAVLTLTELVAGLFSAVGAVSELFLDLEGWSYWAGLFNILALLMLFFGQRLAKDYEGAKTIAIYMVPAILLLYILP